jgi:hypothetical protein
MSSEASFLYRFSGFSLLGSCLRLLFGQTFFCSQLVVIVITSKLEPFTTMMSLLLLFGFPTTDTCSERRGLSEKRRTVLGGEEKDCSDILGVIHKSSIAHRRVCTR